MSVITRRSIGGVGIAVLPGRESVVVFVIIVVVAIVIVIVIVVVLRGGEGDGVGIHVLSKRAGSFSQVERGRSYQLKDNIEDACIEHCHWCVGGFNSPIYKSKITGS